MTAAPPTAMPAIAPVLKTEEDRWGARLYFRLNICMFIWLTAGLAVAPGYTNGSGGVVTQGVAPAMAAVCIPHPLMEVS